MWVSSLVSRTEHTSTFGHSKPSHPTLLFLYQFDHAKATPHLNVLPLSPSKRLMSVQESRQKDIRQHSLCVQLSILWYILTESLWFEV